MSQILVQNITVPTLLTQIDQELSDTKYALTDFQAEIGQSFTTASAFSLSSLDVMMRRQFGPVGLAYIDICADSAGSPGTVLATSVAKNIASDIQGGAGAHLANGYFVNWQFNQALDLSAITIYHLVLRYDPSVTVDGANNIAIFFQNADVYAGGNFETSADAGATWTPQATQDLAFRLFSNSTVSMGNAPLQVFSAPDDPASAYPGMQYFNTTTNKMKMFNGTTWETITSSV